MGEKKDYQDSWKSDWQKQKEEGTGLGGFFQRFTATADPRWVEHWEKIMYEAAGFAYDAADEINSASNDPERKSGLENKIEIMRQSILSNINNGQKDSEPQPTDDEES